MNVTIVDYNSGNISSVINSFKEVAKDKVNIEVTSDLNKIKSSDKVVLPGQGSFKSCVDALNNISGLVDTLSEFAINNKKPLLGICVGLQMFADIGYEETETKGLGWISGKVSKIDNQNGKYKLPHIGWNQISIVKDSKIFKDIENNSHMYFVHSYEFVPEDKNVISATTDYSSNIVCSVEKENIFGTQFHPEKSDKIGLKIIDNFINFCFENIKIHFISPYLYIPLIVCMYILCYNENMTLQQLLIFVFIIFILAYNYYIINTFIHPIYQPLIAFSIYYIYLCNLEINNSITKINEIINFINTQNDKTKNGYTITFPQS